MKRDFLEKAGLEKETIDSIMAEHGKSVEAQKQKVTDLTNEVGTLKGQLTVKESSVTTLEQKLKEYEEKDLTELDKLKKQLDEKDGVASNLEQQLNALKEQSTKEQIKKEFEKAAGKVGIVYVEDAMQLTDMSTLQLNDNGSIDGIDELVTKLATEKPFLVSKEQKEIGGSSNPGGQERTISKEQFQKMGYSERAQLFEKSPGLYKQLNIKE